MSEDVAFAIVLAGGLVAWQIARVAKRIEELEFLLRQRLPQPVDDD